MQTIGIIGAGISGLAAAKAFKERGYKVTVFEKAAAIGGVWDRNRFYINVTTQTTKNEYAYSDFPMPEHYHEWPTGDQMNQYLLDYAAHFDLNAFIQCDTTVLDMHYEEEAWHMVTRDKRSGNMGSHIFDFVVVCTGTFHEKFVPEFPGTDDYLAAGGAILHSSDITDSKLLQGKDVAVVGFAKSATDIATQAADTGASCTLLYRKAQWKVPRFFANKINLKYLLFSRFSEAFFVPYRKTGFQKILHSIGRPLVWAQWRAVELLLKKQFQLKKCGMIPEHRIEEQISCSLGIAPEGFYEKVRSRRINAIHSEIECFTTDGIVLKNGARIQPDLVVMGTGYRQSLPFLNEKYLQLISDERGQFRLHRNIVNPRLPGLGFVGFNSSLFSTLTSEIAANWLAEYVGGRIQLPSQGCIVEEQMVIERWKKTVRPISSEFSGLCVAPFNFQHLDQLMKDMGLKTWAGRNILYNFFKPINPGDYHRLLKRFRSPGGAEKEKGPVKKGSVALSGE
ncbi:flavin-containing monooxygenase [Niabella drilacis]|uniref:Predicted flavoprotein CzcO associated with the cation diffusion facilitator CzcD n=1 Tax=Niabella drilacis (strain DSM 25811 / CCM 8410 / CCUG 62505 / LMG 26954 / E90) TaxID=1285928 RepID=A0A1G6LBP0_NIADE|nr:NAD(P)/FAD-dependent oxidoreductase [Niabella drilacis]SDC40568.1 Predicted flavoprotein CzcO associated with the cation diffusion facilitator CzcD [Niabella drilacis]